MKDRDLDQDLEGIVCEACGSWEFECRDEYFYLTSQLPIPDEKEEERRYEELKH